MSQTADLEGTKWASLDSPKKQFTKLLQEIGSRSLKWELMSENNKHLAPSVNSTGSAKEFMLKRPFLDNSALTWGTFFFVQKINIILEM